MGLLSIKKGNAKGSNDGNLFKGTLGYIRGFSYGEYKGLLLIRTQICGNFQTGIIFLVYNSF